MAAPKKMGARSKLTPELQKKICQAVELCNSLEAAAEYCGVARTTAFMWAQKGREQSRGPYRDFLDAIDAAKAKRQVNINVQMIGHAKKNWQALAWLAERTDPKVFGLRIKVQVNEELELMLSKLEKRLTPQEYERALEAISQPDDSGKALGEIQGVEASGGPRLAAGMGAAIDTALRSSDASLAADGED